MPHCAFAHHTAIGFLGVPNWRHLNSEAFTVEEHFKRGVVQVLAFAVLAVGNETVECTAAPSHNRWRVARSQR